jgi:hypothetical protein
MCGLVPSLAPSLGGAFDVLGATTEGARIFSPVFTDEHLTYRTPTRCMLTTTA